MANEGAAEVRQTAARLTDVLVEVDFDVAVDALVTMLVRLCVSVGETNEEAREALRQLFLPRLTVENIDRVWAWERAEVSRPH